MDFPGGSVVKNLGQEDPLEEEMATHSSIHAWETPWTKQPGGIQSMGLQRMGHNLAPQQQQFASMWRMDLKVSILEAGKPLGRLL